MASDLLVKRLLKQAGVSVLAGLLLSTAAIAEDNAADAGGISIDAGSIDAGGPDVSIDPVDPDMGGDGDDGVDWSGGDDGDTGSDDDGSGDDANDDGTNDGSDGQDGTDDGTVDWSGDDDATDGTDDGADDGTVDGSGDDDCMACNTIDVEVTLDQGPVRGTQPNERTLDDVMSTTSVPGEPVAMNGDMGGVPSQGHDISRDFGSDAGLGGGRDGDLGAQRLRIVK